ncbi:MAG: DNA repair protein RecN [Pyrinomonadaceae bacterium]
MLAFLKVRNIALIDEIEIEFGDGLNLLTGETGSGKSIIVDSLGALTGERIASDLIKDGEQSARIEGLFHIRPTATLRRIFEETGIEPDGGDEIELIVRRELSNSGKNRIFINNQLVTQAVLKKVGTFLVAIHGQGEHAALFEAANHLEILDRFADLATERNDVANAFGRLADARGELSRLKTGEAEKLQLLDVLRFQINEIKAVGLTVDEDTALGEEKRRLNNVEKLTTLSQEAYALLYENTESTIATLEKAARKIGDLTEYEARFGEYTESIRSALAVIEDLAITARDYRNHLEFSPERLEEIESRLAEIARLTRKYGGSIESVLAHLKDCEERLDNIETADLREKELRDRLKKIRQEYLTAAESIHQKRVTAAARFEKAVEGNLKAVALEKARFVVQIERPEVDHLDVLSFENFSAKGTDNVEFYFSANVGEPPKPLARVASGGEASRLMLILKTTAGTKDKEATTVFDEIDAGIGGRVAEAVGLKLKALAKMQQVLCVTHQPQVASQADRHFLIEKSLAKGRTTIAVRELNNDERIEEVARMLAGEKITNAARENAKEMLAASN